MLREISLSCYKKEKFTLQFNSETWCVSELYWSYLKKYNTNKIQKCIVSLNFDWKEHLLKYDDIANVAKINLNFDFDHYFSIKNKLEKKKILLDTLHEGMMIIAENEGWEADSLLDAYNNCLKINVEYQFFIGKIKASPNRKRKVNFWCNWDIDAFEVFLVLYDKNNEEIERTKIIEDENTYNGEFIYYVTYKWIDDKTVLLKDNYMSEKKNWMIKI